MRMKFKIVGHLQSSEQCKVYLISSSWAIFKFCVISFLFTKQYESFGGEVKLEFLDPCFLMPFAVNDTIVK